MALGFLLEQVAKTFFFGQFPSSEHITSRWPHKWKRGWGLLTDYNFFNNIFVWATRTAYMVPQSIIKARQILDFITAAPAGVLFDKLETEERISSLNLNMTWVMRTAVMLQDRFRIQNYFWQSIFDNVFLLEKRSENCWNSAETSARFSWDKCTWREESPVHVQNGKQLTKVVVLKKKKQKPNSKKV